MSSAPRWQYDLHPHALTGTGNPIGKSYRIQHRLRLRFFLGFEFR